MKGLSMQEVASSLHFSGKDVKGQRSSSLAEGLRATKFPHTEGLVEVSPSQLLGLLVPRLELHGDSIEGYQREVNRAHVTRIMQALQQGKEMPPIMVSLWDSRAWLTEGQHRALGAIAARIPIEAVVKKRSMADQIALFGNQAKARRPSSDLLILRGSSPYDEYIQDAVTDPTHSHPWAKLVATRAGDARKLSPTTARRMLYSYVGETTNYGHTTVIDERWDERAADELGKLIAVFGNKETNPHAFSSVGAKALAITALNAIKRAPGGEAENGDRWVRHMPKFPFASYAYIKNVGELADQMLNHWNKRLPNARRAYRL